MSFFAELKRRNVVKVAVLYIVASWLILQITDVLTSLLPVPEWAGPFVFVLLSVGFPLALIFSWVYELTPEGLRREREVNRSESITEFTGKRINVMIVALLILVVGVFLVERIVFHRPVEPPVRADVTIAVLPFENRSANPEDAYFVDGVHDELLIRLSRVSAWNVISRTSVEAIRNSNLSIPEIGRKLGATHVIEGSVQRSADRIRLTIQVIEAVSDTHVWAPEPYDRELTAENLFAIQSDIAYSVADSLQTVLPAGEQEYIAQVGTGNLEAYDKYLMGRQLLRLRKLDELNRSVELFRQAVNIDPDFAAAWAGLSDAIRIQAFHAEVSPTDALKRAESAARRSLRLDPESAEAWASLAGALQVQGELGATEEAFRRSVQLNRNYADARMWYGVFLSDTGRSDEAVEHFEVALILDPFHPVVRLNFAETMLNLGRSDEARELLDEQLERFPNRSGGYASAASWAADYYGDFSRAIEMAKNAMSIDKESPAGPLLASIYLDFGDAEKSRLWLEKLPANAPASSKSNAAVVRAFMELKVEDYDAAYESAMTAYEIGHSWSMIEALRVLKDVDMHNGEYEKALRRYDGIYPGLSDGTSFVPGKFHIDVASDIAGLLVELDRDNDALSLADQIFTFSESYDVRVSGIGLARARAYMVLGDRDKALAELKNLIDLGWRSRWWYTFDLDPAFEPLRNEREFNELRDYVAADMASRYQSIQEDG